MSGLKEQISYTLYNLWDTVISIKLGLDSD